jgi:tetratricopeptide (TPR) repeat protein
MRARPSILQTPGNHNRTADKKNPRGPFGARTTGLIVKQKLTAEFAISSFRETFTTSMPYRCHPQDGSTTRSSWFVRKGRLVLLVWLFGLLTAPAFAAKKPLQIPDRDDAELKLIGQQPAITSPAQLQQDVDQMIKALRAGLDDDDKDDADRTLKAFGNNQPALNNAAAIAWVQSCPGTALLLAAEAVHLNPNDTNSANTLAALLVQAGYAHKGIPILEHLVKLFPSDPTILNNLGQAWFDVGEKEKAKGFLGRCIATAPDHGAAQASLGVVAQSEGKAAEATAHFKAAAESNNSPAACYELDRSNTPSAMPSSLLRLLRTHEYFNPHHFVPPAPQSTLEEYNTKQAELDAFVQLVTAKEKISADLAVDSTAAGQRELMREMMIAQNSPSSGAQFNYNALNGKRLGQPYNDFLERVSSISGRITELQNRLSLLAAESGSKQGKLEADWEQTYGDQFGEGKDPTAALEAKKKLCEKKRDIAQDCLRAMSARYAEFVEQTLPPLRVATNDALNCLPLMVPAPMVRGQFYIVTSTYLHAVGLVGALLPTVGPPCTNLPKSKGSPRDDNLPDANDCPLSLKANLIVAKLKADCKSLSFEFEAGLDFKATKDFRSGETTLSAGVGANIGVGNVSGGFVASWNKDNKLSYVGMQVSAGASLSGISGLSGTANTSSSTSVTASTSSLTPDVVNVKASSTVGVTIGPSGVEPTVGGGAAATVLGQDLFETKL